MKLLKRLLKQTTNGILLILIGILHTRLVVSSDGCGKQFLGFADSYFYKISGGLSELPATAGKTNFEALAAFWFFYSAFLLVPLGLAGAFNRKRQKSSASLFHSNVPGVLCLQAAT
jgi:hypothetical protein